MHYADLKTVIINIRKEDRRVSAVKKVATESELGIMDIICVDSILIVLTYFCL